MSKCAFRGYKTYEGERERETEINRYYIEWKGEKIRARTSMANNKLE